MTLSGHMLACSLAPKRTASDMVTTDKRGGWVADDNGFPDGRCTVAVQRCPRGASQHRTPSLRHARGKGIIYVRYVGLGSRRRIGVVSLVSEFDGSLGLVVGGGVLGEGLRGGYRPMLTHAFLGGLFLFSACLGYVGVLFMSGT